MIDKETLKLLLTNPKQAPQEHFIATCPWCNKPNHFYIKHTNTNPPRKKDNTGVFDCKKCGIEGNIFKFLFKIGKSDLILYKSIDLQSSLKSLRSLDEIGEEEEIDFEAPTCKLPIGFKRVYKDKYLSSRGFTQKDFELYPVGKTKLKAKFKHYSIISIEEDNECKGYLGRCTLDNFVADLHGLKRYENSYSTKFSKLLGGYDQVTANTTLVIIVEGLFDKIRLDNLLQLHDSEEIKTVCTFGKKISQAQIYKLIIKGVPDIILFYDNDAANDVKKTSYKIKDNFSSIRLAYLSSDRDTADSTDDEIFAALSDLKTPGEFFMSKLRRYKLK